MIANDFTGAELDTLIALVERGPLHDGDLPSKSGRDCLVKIGFASQTVVNGEEGYQAATLRGVEAYKKYFGASTVQEAIVKRKEKQLQTVD